MQANNYLKTQRKTKDCREKQDSSVCSPETDAAKCLKPGKKIKLEVFKELLKAECGPAGGCEVPGSCRRRRVHTLFRFFFQEQHVLPKKMGRTLRKCPLRHWYPTFLALGTGFLEIFPWTEWGGGRCDDSSASHLLCTLFLLLLHQLHRRSSGLRSQRLGTPAARC